MVGGPDVTGTIIYASDNVIRRANTASYVVWFDGTNYHADSMTGGTDYSDPDAYTIIQHALTIGGVTVIKGPTTYPLTAGLTEVIAGSRILMDQTATLKPLSGVVDTLTVNADDVVLDSLNIDTTNSGVTGTAIKMGVSSQTQRPKILNCNILMGNGMNGLRLGDLSGVAFVYANRIQSQLGPSGSGMSIQGADHHIYENDVGGFGSAAAITLSNVDDVSLIGNQTYSSAFGIDLYLPSRLRVIGNHVNFHGQEGIRIHADTGGPWNLGTISGNVITNNGQNLANTYSGIHISTSGGSIIKNADIGENTIFDTQGTKTQKYGIQIDDTGFQSSLISKNNVNGNRTGGINPIAVGTGLIISDNPGFNPVGWASVTPSVPSTGVDQQNLLGYPILSYLTGLGSGITAVGVTDPAGTLQSFTRTGEVGDFYRVEPLGKIRLTYTGSPTWKWFGL